MMSNYKKVSYFHILNYKGVKSLMDKLTTIQLKEVVGSNRFIERELGIGSKTVTRYWKKHLALIDSIKLNPSGIEAKDQIVEAPTSGFRWACLYESANQKVLMDAHIHFFGYLIEIKVIYKGLRVCIHIVKKGVKTYLINIKHYLKTLFRQRRPYDIL